MASSTYQLRPATPVRAFGIAAILCVLGAVLIVLTTANDWHWVVTVLGVVALVLGIALIVVAVMAMFRLRVQAILDTTGYHITSARGEVDGTWIDVTRVTLNGPRLLIERRDGGDHEVLTPLGDRDPQADRMLQDMSRRLSTRFG